jgi:hypothetical protein
LPSEVTGISIPHYRQKINQTKSISAHVSADNGSFDSAPLFSYTTFGAVRHNRGFSRTAKSVILGRKIARFYQKF